MKKFILLIFLFSVVVCGQKLPEKNLFELKTELGKIKPEEKNPIEAQFKLKKKKPGLAILYSVLLPGMGELYAGDYSTGKYFTIADGVFWGVLAGFNIYAVRQEDNYKAYAKSHARVNPAGKDDKYFADIGNFMSLENYNNQKKLDRTLNEVYSEDTHYWKWHTQSERKEYRNTWKSSENAYNNIRFAAGALVLNRIVSAINAVRLVSKHNKQLKKDLGWQVSFGVDQLPETQPFLTLNFHTSF